MSKAVIVEAKDKKIVGTVTDQKKVKLSSRDEIDEILISGGGEIMDILSGEIDDPLMKRCSRCIKKGRVPFHPLEDFSMLKTGKRHSQCRICRSEQATAWCQEQAVKRKAYHKEYHKNRRKRENMVGGIKKLIKDYGKNTEPEVNDAYFVNAENALFVAFTEEELQDTD